MNIPQKFAKLGKSGRSIEYQQRAQEINAHNYNVQVYNTQQNELHNRKVLSAAAIQLMKQKEEKQKKEKEITALKLAKNSSALSSPSLMGMTGKTLGSLSLAYLFL